MGAVSCRRLLVLLLVVGLVGSMLPVSGAVANGDGDGHSHFRYGQIFWSPGDAPNSVEFTVQNSWRRSAYSGTSGGVCVDPTEAGVPTVPCSGSDGHPEPGDVLLEAVAAGTTLRTGDGAVIGSPRGNLLYLVTSVDRVNDWLFGVAIDPAALPEVSPTIAHTYTSPGQYVAFMDTCCRIGTTSVNQHMNNSNARYRTETLVDTQAPAGSPVSVMPPLVQCPIEGDCEFQIPATDPGDGVRFRFATQAESGIGNQPGPPQAPNAATVDADSGVYQWDTRGAALASLGRNTLYSTQVVIEDLDGSGAVRSTVAVDFFIQLVDEVGEPPVFGGPGAPDGAVQCGTTVPARVGQQVSFTAWASDPDGGQTTLNVVGLPAGATMDPALPHTEAGTVTSDFAWTPTSAQRGNHVMSFTAVDDDGQFALCPVTVAVGTGVDAATLFGRRMNSAYAGDPVNVATGNFTDTWVDVDFAEQVFGLTATRTYNAMDTDAGVLGVGWSTPYEVRVEPRDDGSVGLVDHDGRQVAFTPDGEGGWDAPEELFGELVQDGDGRFEIVFHAGERWRFDDDGWLVRLSSVDGPETVIERDGDGRALTAEGPFGHGLTFTYDNDRLAAVTATDGRQVTYGYDDNGHLVAVTGPDGATKTHQVDADGLITRITDAADRLVIANAYDDLRRVVWQETPAGDEVTFDYDLAAGTTTVATAAGQTVVFRSDAGGRLLDVTDPFGAVHERTYDGAGNLATITDRVGEITELVYDGHGNVVEVTYTDGTAESFVYDDASRLISHSDTEDATTILTYDGESRVPSTVTDPDGATTTIASDDGLVTVITDADGVTTTFEHDEAGNVVATTDGVGNVTETAYDTAGRIVSVTTPSGDETRFVYDAAGRLIERHEPATAGLGEGTTWPDPASKDDCKQNGWEDFGFRNQGQCVRFVETGQDSRDHDPGDGHAPEVVWRFAYDPAGNLIEEIDPTGATTTHTYDDAGLLTATTDPVGATTEFVYDTEGKLLEEIAPGGATTTFEYGLLGRLERIVGPEGVTTEFTRDAEGRLIETVHGDGTNTTAVYDARGRVAEETDGAGGTTVYSYDSMGRLTSEEDPTGLVTSYGYDQTGRLTTVTDPSGAVESHTYTPAGRLAATTDATGRTTSYDYDPAGRLTVETDPAGNTTTFEYDADGRIVAEESAEGRRIELELDPAGRVLAETMDGDTSRFGYDPLGRFTTEIDPEGGTQSFVYDPAGRLVEAIDANGGKVTYGYDGRGNRTARTDQSGTTETWAYDLADRLVAHTDRAGRATSLAYDDAGRLAQIADPSGRTEQLTYDGAGRITRQSFKHDGDEFEISFAYDQAGRRTEMSDATGTTTYGYQHGRLVEVTGPDGGSVTYGYDPAGRRTSMTVPDGSETTFSYDPAGRLATVVHPELGETAYSYDADGWLTGEQLPDGTRSYVRDGRGNVTGFSQTLNGATTTTELQRDAAGRIVVDTTDGTAVAYTYDPAGQLVEVDDPSTPTSYTYDPTGNRTAKSTPEGTTTYTYDVAGQLVDKTDPTGTTTFSYDAAGRRTATDGPDRAVQIGYDPAGRPATLTTTGPDGQSLQLRDYDGDSRLVAIDLQEPDGDIAHKLTWDVATDLPQIAAWSIDGQTRQLIHGHGVIGHASDDATGVFSRDVHGSLQADAGDGALVAADNYDPYGTPTTDPHHPVALGYRGELHVDGLIHLRARDYDPTVGAFTTLDPLDGLDGQVTVANGYHYAANDPLNRTDPAGLTPFSDREIRSLYMYGARDARELYMRPHAFDPAQSRVTPFLVPTPPPTTTPRTPWWTRAGRAVASVGSRALGVLSLAFMLCGDTPEGCDGSPAAQPDAAGGSGAPPRTPPPPTDQDECPPDWRDEAPSSSKLRRNLIAAGFTPRPGDHAHHIVAGKDKPAEPARDVLLNFCIGINSADNGVFLRGTKDTPGSGAAHLGGVHSSNTYYTYVNTQLARAASRPDAIRRLHSIRDMLGRGVIP